MNQYNRNVFERLHKAGEDYKQQVADALATYRTDAAAAAQFKAENEHLESAKRKAKNAITTAENAFTSSVAAEIDGLRDELFNHLTAKPAQAFIDALSLYNTFDITPGETELRALLKLNAGNSLGVRAVNRLLEKQKSNLRVDAPDASVFEGDIRLLERMSKGGLMYSPLADHAEMCAIYKGEKRSLFREDGSTYDGGYVWDSISLIGARKDFENQLAGMSAMADRWSSDILPDIRKVNVKDAGEVEQFVKDYEDTATADVVDIRKE